MAIDPEILSIFLAEARGYLSILDNPRSDRAERQRAAHGLRGAASMIGLTEIVTYSKQLEDLLRGPGTPAMGELLAQVQRLLEALPSTSRAPSNAAGTDGSAPWRRGGSMNPRATASSPQDGRPVTPVPFPASTTAPASFAAAFEEEWDPETARILQALFAEEAHDHLEVIFCALQRLDGAAAPSALEEILRKVHTLKGSAATVGLPEVSTAAHRIESYLLTLADPSTALSSRQLDLLFTLIRLLRRMVQPELGAAERQALLAQLTAIVEQPGGKLSDTLSASASRSSPPETHGSFSATPPPARGHSGSAMAIRRAALPRERRARDRRRGSERRLDDQQLRVDVKRLDELMNSVGELIIDRTRIERQVERLHSLANDLGMSRKSLRAALARNNGQTHEAVQSRLHELELEIGSAINNLERMTAGLSEDADNLHRTTHAIQEQLTQVRMIPIQWLHARLQHPLRELARRVGKEIELSFDDESSEMDRSLAEYVSDSLIQLVRNAVAHGIETPAERQRWGKPPVGTIRISARHQGDQVYIEVEDDGMGIDSAVLRKAVTAWGKIPADVVTGMSDTELFDTIFASGFTTRTQADQLAGRGMGLDIVRQNITALGGNIQVSSRPRQGTRFTICLPMTTAIAQALLFKLGDHSYAVPVAHVVEYQQLDSLKIRQLADQYEIFTRDSWVPLFNLDRLVRPEVPQSPAVQEQSVSQSSRLSVIVLLFGNRRFAITCTKVIGPREIVLKRLGPLLAALPLFAGATISGSSKVQFILDVATLTRIISPLVPEMTCSVDSMSQPWESSQSGKPRILLADDSRSVREAVSNILRNAGYLVEEAKDGWEAWEHLQHQVYDLLITDLEMPRIHGHELIEKCRQHDQLHDLPIVVLSSRSATRTRQESLSLGASAFLAKPINRRLILQKISSLLSAD